MSKVAFQARELDGEPISGGSVAIGDGETLDVAAALEEGNGTITVDADSAEAHALSTYPGVKRVAVPEDAQDDDDEAAPRVSRAAADKAAKLGVDLNEVEGTGAGGAITVGDVERTAEED